MLDGINATDFDSLYPQLWNGCIGAWCPSLGIAGSKLYDYSGYNNHGTLNGSTANLAWANNNGLVAYQSNATSDYMAMGSTVPTPTTSATLSVWFYKPLASSTCAIGWFDNNGYRFGLEISANNAYCTSEAAGVFNYPYCSEVNTGWNHYVVTFYASVTSLWVNGIKQTLTPGGGGAPSVLAITGTFNFGKVISTYNSSGVLTDDAFVYKRVISVEEILTLYSSGYGRGIAYTPVQRDAEWYFFSSGVLQNCTNRITGNAPTQNAINNSKPSPPLQNACNDYGYFTPGSITYTNTSSSPFIIPIGTTTLTIQLWGDGGGGSGGAFSSSTGSGGGGGGGGYCLHVISSPTGGASVAFTIGQGGAAGAAGANSGSPGSGSTCTTYSLVANGGGGGLTSSTGGGGGTASGGNGANTTGTAGGNGGSSTGGNGGAGANGGPGGNGGTNGNPGLSGTFPGAGGGGGGGSVTAGGAPATGKITFTWA